MDEKIFLGMTRPSIDQLICPRGYSPTPIVVVCPHGHTDFSQEAIWSCWGAGHFDYPIYCTKQEMMDRIIEKQKEVRGQEA